MKSVVFLYEESQVDRLDDVPAKAPGEERDLLVYGAELERLLTDRGMSFISARPFRTATPEVRLQAALREGEALLADVRGLSYGPYDLRTFLTPLPQFYLAPFFYYLDIAAHALVGYDHVYCFSTSAAVPPTSGVLEGFRAAMVTDALSLVAQHRGIGCTVLPQSQANVESFVAKRMLFGALLASLNSFVAAVVPARPIRILASENWKNIAAFMEKLPESELVLLDRTESLKAGWRNILRNRMRFVHSEEYVPRAAHARIREALGAIAADAPIQAAFADIPLAPLLTRVRDRLLTEGVRRVLYEIEGTEAMYTRFSPQVVLVRAGTSAQTHFAVMCEVAKARGIPSLELQHGTLYFGPQSFSKKRAAAYVAAYGPLVRRDLETIGYDATHVFEVGSPRFDAYQEALDAERGAVSDAFRIVLIAPRVAPGFWTDSYDVADYFRQVGKSLEGLSGVHVTVKLRPVRAEYEFYSHAIAEAFAGIPHRIKQYESLPAVFSDADAIVSCYSTTLVEGPIVGKPTVFFLGELPSYESHAEDPEQKAAIDAGALMLARTHEELAELLRAWQQHPALAAQAREATRAHIAREYRFDGKSAERLAGVVRELAEKPR